MSTGRVHPCVRLDCQSICFSSGHDGPGDPGGLVGQRNAGDLRWLALFDGQRLRALTVVDAYTREALAIYVDQGIKGEQVVEAMDRIASMRGAPRAIRVDNVLGWEVAAENGQQVSLR